ncbi:hypothetical protein [Cellulophaga lytica]|uniref:hypothetical protein n=1 Tax=Cellulophaga lytica TaxID=979 RepID=UPI003CE4F2EC
MKTILKILIALLIVALFTSCTAEDTTPECHYITRHYTVNLKTGENIFIEYINGGKELPDYIVGDLKHTFATKTICE